MISEGHLKKTKVIMAEELYNFKVDSEEIKIAERVSLPWLYHQPKMKSVAKKLEKC